MACSPRRHTSQSRRGRQRIGEAEPEPAVGKELPAGRGGLTLVGADPDHGPRTADCDPGVVRNCTPAAQGRRKDYRLVCLAPSPREGRIAVTQVAPIPSVIDHAQDTQTQRIPRVSLPPRMDTAGDLLLFGSVGDLPSSAGSGVQPMNAGQP